MFRRVADWLYRQSSLVKAKIQGFEFGIVVDVEDPWKLGRIRVRFPWHYDGDMSDWALPASANLSDETGSTFNIPRVDDLVLCVFYGGDTSRPAYLGSVWTYGGIGPRGQIKPRKTLLKGYQPQEPNPETYDPNVQPNLDPKPYPEPPEGAWVSNDPNSRVNEFKTYGGLRLLWEEMKRRLRIWTHKEVASAFKLEIDHFDGESVDPPRGTPYHRFRLESPQGTIVQIEEDVSGSTYRTIIQHHTGHLVEILVDPASNYIRMRNPGGEEIKLDELHHQLIAKDRLGGRLFFDAVNGIRKLEDPSGQELKLTNESSVEINTPYEVKIIAAGNALVTSTGGNLDLTAPAGTVTIDGNSINIG